jgi:hypothetical protein
VLLDENGAEIAAVSEFLHHHMLADDARPSSLRSYAYELPAWFRFLRAIGVAWDAAGRAEARDFALWLKTARKPAAVLEERAAWVSAGRGERDPQRFWPSVRAAPRQTAPGVGAGAGGDGGAGPGWVGAGEWLLTDLAPLDEQVWLVVDDVTSWARRRCGSWSC